MRFKYYNFFFIYIIILLLFTYSPSLPGSAGSGGSFEEKINSYLENDEAKANQMKMEEEKKKD